MSRTIDITTVTKAQRAKRKWELLQEELKRERKANHTRPKTTLIKTN